MLKQFSLKNSMKPDINSLVNSVDPDQLASLVNSVVPFSWPLKKPADQDPHSFQCNM